jgi:hypothetical protein
MKRLLGAIALLLCLGQTPCLAADPITKVTSPREVVAELRGQTGTPGELDGLQWNRWTSKNFTVCALNDTQAQYLHQHLELVKGWVFARWGLYDADLSAECKVIVVDKPELFKKLFGLDATRVEVRRDASGKIKENVIYLLATGLPSRTVPGPLTEVCMAELAQKYNVKFAPWATRGMAALNGSLDQIRERAAELKLVLDKNEPMYFTKGLMELDADGYKKLDEGKKRLFDNCAMMLCLMVRKEFGQDSYLKLMREASEGGPEAAVAAVVRFPTFAAFDRSFKQFVEDLTSDIAAGKTPDSYLQITEK